ncbi:hypothetical protein TrVE_jg12133 [Triparma verrucosa]|uniref:Uncharacterized protein n=1 Tax=Triparma verrucosa TaxID=1606542 RepID=A0A9W7C8E0_9STRA|nr:hypothetical protein TrVE_jg12133 [Triparma verrucosa]
MRVKCRVKGLTFFVPCGDGEQSLKWLSLVAAQQYELRKPSGRTRNREQANAARGFFLPMNVTSGKGGKMSNPDAKINEVFTDGAEVVVELQEEVEVDSIGAPVLSDWQQKSFCVGEASQLRLKSEALRKEEEKKKMLAKMAIENRKKYEMNMIVSSSIDYTMADMGLDTSAYDWNAIVEVIAGSSQKDQDELEEYFHEAYPLLDEIFVHYAGEKKKDSGSETKLTFAEFSHFLHSVRVYHAYRDLQTIKDCVLEAKRRLVAATESKNADDPSEEFMTKEEFFACMIYLSIQKLEGTKRSSGCLREVVEKFVEPHWTEGRAEDKTRVLMDSDKVTKMLGDSWPYLKQVYNFYVQTDTGVMTQETFGNVMKDAGLLMRNPGEQADAAEDRMSSLTLNAFFGAQGFPARQLELAELVFAEFLEATCRLSVESLSQQTTSFEKFQLGLDALLDLRRNMR